MKITNLMAQGAVLEGNFRDLDFHVSGGLCLRPVARNIVFCFGFVSLVGLTGFAGLNVWQSSSKPAQAAGQSVLGVNSVKPAPGPINQPLFLANNNVEPLSSGALNNYVVAADVPHSIYIGGINVSARVMPMVADANKDLQLPVNNYDVGWYSGSVKPGQSGAMLLDGRGIETGPYYGVFSYISKLVPGDRVSIKRGDGVMLNYIVVSKEVFKTEEVDMNRMLSVYSGADQGLNMISTAGAWTSDGSTLDGRVLVFAVLQG